MDQGPDPNPMDHPIRSLHPSLFHNSNLTQWCPLKQLCVQLFPCFLHAQTLCAPNAARLRG